MSIIVPAKNVEAVDLMDDVIATLHTVHAAMTGTDGMGPILIEECASVLWTAAERLEPIRQMLDEMGAA